MSRRRRQTATPTPAEIWRILRGIARDERIARRRDRALHQALTRQFRREREARERANAALERKYQEERAQREREHATREQKYREEEAQRKREQAAREEKYQAEKARWDREKAQRDEEKAERDRRLDRRLNQIDGDAANRWGQLIEALVAGDTVRLLQETGLPIESLVPRLRSQNKEGVWREYDIVAAGVSVAVVIEVKTTLTPADVARFTDRIRDFRVWRPDYKHHQIYGAVGYLTPRDDAMKAAEAAGFYLIRAVGSNASIVNTPDFQPRTF